MKCKDLEVVLGCFDNGTIKQTVVTHYEYGINAAGNIIIVATRYTDSDGVPIDTSGGTVTPGACPIPSPDVEWEKLCDVQADGSVIEFFCRVITTFDVNGNATSTPVNLELDKVTAYTPTGTVGSCGQDCDAATAQGVVSTWG